MLKNEEKKRLRKETRTEYPRTVGQLPKVSHTCNENTRKRKGDRRNI